MMSDLEKPTKKSYTSLLIEYLESCKTPKKYLDMIKTFSTEYADKMNKEKELNRGIITWGKYKNKRLEEVFKLDPGYMTWLNKNSKYLSEDNQKIVESLIKTN